MKIKYTILFLFIFISHAYAQISPEQLPKPSPVQLAWHDMELTMFIHFGPATWQDQEYDDLSTPLSQINPTQLNTDQWADVAVSYGAKMHILHTCICKKSSSVKYGSHGSNILLVIFCST